MERFRVTLPGETHIIGAPEPGVLVVTICSVVRENPVGGLEEHICSLSLSGMDSTTYTSLDGERICLEPGDLIGLEVLPDGPFDPPSDPQPMPVPPWTAGDRVRKVAAKDEHEPVREAAEELGWILIEDPDTEDLANPSPSFQPDSPPPGPAINTSSTNGMERFRVSLRGQTHVIGVPGPGVLSLMLCAVVRHPPGGDPEHECILDLGGLYSSGIHVNWPKYELKAGDTIEVEVLPPGSFDEPLTQRTEAQISAERQESMRDYVRTSAKKLGWTLIEGPPPHSL